MWSLKQREENAKEDRVWENTLARDQPQTQKMKFPPGGILSTHTPAKEAGTQGGGGGGASETMHCQLRNTNRLLPTKHKVPVGK